MDNPVVYNVTDDQCSNPVRNYTQSDHNDDVKDPGPPSWCHWPYTRCQQRLEDRGLTSSLWKKDNVMLRTSQNIWLRRISDKLRRTVSWNYNRPQLFWLTGLRVPICCKNREDQEKGLQNVFWLKITKKKITIWLTPPPLIFGGWNLFHARPS